MILLNSRYINNNNNNELYSKKNLTNIFPFSIIEYREKLLSGTIKPKYDDFNMNSLNSKIYLFVVNRICESIPQTGYLRNLYWLSSMVGSYASYAASMAASSLSSYLSQ